MRELHPAMRRLPPRKALRVAAFAFAALCLAAALPRGAALAQDAGADPEEIKKKVLEIERLMKGAEEALARSTDTRSAQERAAEAARKILDEKAKQETGKSSEDLRKEAQSGSTQAAETLERLTKAANEEAAKAAERLQKLLDGGAGGASGASAGVKDLIEKIRGEGQGASDGIKWLLEKALRSGSGGGGSSNGGHSSGKQPNADDPKKPEKGDDEKPSDSAKRPESKTEPPKNPELQQWLVELPPQVRKAYETQDWDSIPPKWRELLRQWTKKMADDLSKERR